ncbi:MAG: phosphoribosylamine--glycine ligase, partial [Candidatus Gastranaerophilales bacterium]|nr:phosphoribosylamine--glycine ligase [Candidatus Gastranaerophilales bacterium]
YKPVVMENYVPGRMLSFQVITDGYDAVPLPTTYVYKKAEDGNFGANTDGMGAYSPLSYVDVEMQAKIAEKIFFPIIDGLNAEKMSYAGFLRATIVIDEKNNPQLLGINVVSGDCELQTTLPLLADDIFDIMMFTVNGALADSYEMFKIREDYSVCVSFVSDGYPQEYKKGFVIEGLDEIDDENTVIYHACTKKNVYNETLTDGGKVLSVVSTAATLGRARELAYEAVDLISFENMRYRKDIAAEKVACKMDI